MMKAILQIAHFDTGMYRKDVQVEVLPKQNDSFYVKSTWIGDAEEVMYEIDGDIVTPIISLIIYPAVDDFDTESERSEAAQKIIEMLASMGWRKHNLT